MDNGSKKKRGRPFSDVLNKRDNFVKVRLTVSEMRELNRLSSEVNMSKSETFRAALRLFSERIEK